MTPEEGARSRADRLDPGAELRQQADGLSALAGRPWSGFLRALGVTQDVLDEAGALRGQISRMLGGLDEAAKALAPLGWITFEASPTEDYIQAGRLAQAGNTEAADDVLIKSWNETDATLLRMSVQRVQGLYRVAAAEYVEPDAPNVGHERAMLIHEAVENHREERYASAINLVLPQIDGIVADFSEGGVRSLAAIAAHASRARMSPTRPP